MKAVLAATAAAFFDLTGEGSASAQSTPGAPAAAATVDIQVCNHSGRDATVAVSYVEPGDERFVNRGWYDVADGACAQLVRTGNANFYLYADATDESGHAWAGDHPLCVQYPGPYRFWSTDGTACEPEQVLRPFVPIHAEAPGPYVWNLNP